MLYIHVPFCHSKCHYCAFFSKSRPTADEMHLYVDALLREMENRHEEYAHPLRTLYLGGGTPSILPISEMARIAEGVQRWFDTTQLQEATLECNPEDIDASYLHDLQSLRLFNRLSIGIQSTDDAILHRLGRRHTAQQALRAVEQAHTAGFVHLSADLIYGTSDILPATDCWSLVDHLSLYALTVEERTVLAHQVARGEATLPTDDEVAEQYLRLHEQLTRLGFHQYEVSNYARPGGESQHNRRYWDRTPYVGLGPGAHSFDGMHRRWNKSHLRSYLTSAIPPHDEEALTERDAYNERLMTSLRTTDGLPKFAIPAEQQIAVEKQMRAYADEGWIVISPQAYRPTPVGLLHADGMAAALFI